MNKRGMSFTFLTLVLICLTIGAAIQANKGFDVETFNNKFNWTHKNITVESQPHLGNAVESLVNGIGEAYFSIAKWAAVMSAENPTVPFQLLLYCLIISIFAPIIILVVKLLVIIFLLTKEVIQSRKEKKLLQKK